MKTGRRSAAQAQERAPSVPAQPAVWPKQVISRLLTSSSWRT